MADTKTGTGDEVAKLPPDTIVQEIERTRAELARTIDAISDRVSPKSAARRTVAKAKERAGQVDPRIAAAAAAVVVTGVVILLWRRSRK
jgi:hypothetical protein